MVKGKIRRLSNLPSKELEDAQEFFIKDAEENSDKHFEDYIKLISSMDGRYICADLFKTTFSLYAESRESHSKYNAVVHNSAAVLSSVYFDMMVKQPNIKKCIFLSGTPGAGKSMFIQALYNDKLISEDTIIFEGDISSPSILEKMQECKDNNINIEVYILNPTLELAQRNVIERKNTIGRGASCETMARIMSNIPNALRNIITKFDIELIIINKVVNTDIEYIIGTKFLYLLERGTYEEILIELKRLREEILMEFELGEENEKSR